MFGLDVVILWCVRDDEPMTQHRWYPVRISGPTIDDVTIDVLASDEMAAHNIAETIPAAYDLANTIGYIRTQAGDVTIEKRTDGVQGDGEPWYLISVGDSSLGGEVWSEAEYTIEGAKDRALFFAEEDTIVGDITEEN